MKDGRDALYSTDVEIDEDVREEYWTQIRKRPENVHVTRFRANGKCPNNALLGTLTFKFKTR
jgi:hypothetical protein